MTMARRLRILVALLVLALAWAAAGCTTVPTTGPVEFQKLGPGERTGSVDVGVEVQDIAPEPGDTPLQIVHGFLQTMVSYQAENPMARQFLTPKADAEWQPGRRILVHDGGLPVPGEQENWVYLSGTRVGEVGDDRGWRSAEAGTQARVPFKLKKVDGEWRIDQLPDLIFMTKTNFEREFQPFNLYYYDPDFEILVPDPVYLPRRGDLPTTLVNALLQGPTEWLEPVVRTVAPPGTRLQVPSVQLSGETARIELTEAVQQLTTRQRQLLAAQLVWTLRQVADIRRVSLLVDQVPLDVFGESADSSAAWSEFDPAVTGAIPTGFVFQEGRLHGIDGQRLIPRPADMPELGFQPPTYAVGIFSDTVGTPRRSDPVTSVERVALVGEDGRSLWSYSGQGELRRMAPGVQFQDIRSLSWDRTGQLWVVDRLGGSSRILVIDPAGVPRELAVPGLEDVAVRQLAVSRDGGMVAVVVDLPGPSQDRTEVLVGLIEREELPRIRSLRRLPAGYPKVTDVAWSGPAELAVVGEDAVRTSHVSRVLVDGSLSEPVNDAPASPVSVAAAPGRPLIVGDSEGEVYVRDEQAPWRSLGRGSQPAYAG